MIGVSVVILDKGIIKVARYIDSGVSSVTARSKITTSLDRMYDKKFAPTRYEWPDKRQLCLPRPGWLLFESLITGQATAVDSFLEPSGDSGKRAIPYLERCPGAVFGNRVIYWPASYTQAYLMGENNIAVLEDLLGVDRPTIRFYTYDRSIVVRDGELDELLLPYYDDADYSKYVERNPDLLTAFNHRKVVGMSINQWGRRHWLAHGDSENRSVVPVATNKSIPRLTDKYLFLSRKSLRNNTYKSPSTDMSHAHGTNISISEWSRYFPDKLFYVFDNRLKQLLEHGSDEDALFTLLKYGFNPDRMIYRTKYLDLHKDRPRVRLLINALRNKLKTSEPRYENPTIIDSTVNEVSANFDGQKDGYVLLADTYDEGWTAKVDGESRPLLLANNLQKAVVFTRDEHNVTFRYNMIGYKAVTLASIITPVLFIVFLIIHSQWQKFRRLRVSANSSLRDRT